MSAKRARTESNNDGPPAWSQLTDLASSDFGGRVLFATDEFFAIGQNLLESGDAIFDPAAFTEFGKLMDGWESRRKRIPGHDWVVIKLALPGVIHGFDIDTAHFTGNFAPRASVQAACLDEDPALVQASLGKMGTCATPEEIEAAEKVSGSADWTTLIPRMELRSGVPETRHHWIMVDKELSHNKRWTHLRLNMFPDGGIARLRVYGTPILSLNAGDTIDLLAAENGGQAVGCSNQHFGHPRNLILPGRGLNMGQGWETARHPHRPAVLVAGADGLIKDLDSDWSLLRLCGSGGHIQRLVVDTNHFKGNFPESCRVDACRCPKERLVPLNWTLSDGLEAIMEREEWHELLPRSKLQASSIHTFTLAEGKLNDCGDVTHLRITIFPDGGIMRLRAFGILASARPAKG